MKKTIICMILVLAMVFGVTSALAAKSVKVYCPICDTDRYFYMQCPGGATLNSPYYSHAVPDGIQICNYYIIKYNMKGRCPECGITEYYYGTYHNHVEIHQCMFGARVVCME